MPCHEAFAHIILDESSFVQHRTVSDASAVVIRSGSTGRSSLPRVRCTPVAEHHAMGFECCAYHIDDPILNDIYIACKMLHMVRFTRCST